MRIKRLYEADDIQQMPMNGQAPAAMPQAAPQMPDMAPPTPVQSPAEMMPDFSFEEEPHGKKEDPQEALPQPDVMNLTIQELMDRCQSINPLVCMGLEQFINSNKDAIMSQTTGDSPEEDVLDTETDLNFSKQMEPQAPEFSLDQPAAELDFPQE
jgi:hypothetical protein